MGVTGHLKTMSPGDLLQWLSLSHKSGTLLMANKAVEKRFVFREGRIISSASNDPREYLGQFLMSHGYLSEAELKKAMEVQQQSGILLGKILVMIGLITEEDLLRLMRIKVEEEIYDTFLWDAGEFEFNDENVPHMNMVPLQIEVTGMLMEGTRRVDEWPRIRELIPNDKYIPTILRPLEERDDLDDADRMVLVSVDGRRSIGQIVLESRSSEFLVCSLLRQLIGEGVVAVRPPAVTVPPEVPAVVQPAPVPVAAGSAPSFDEGDEVLSLLKVAQVAMRSKDFEKTQRLLKAAQNLDPNHPKVRTAIRGAETAILGELRNHGITESSIPKLKRTFEELTSMNLTPNEGFILSRIDGTWDIGSLVKVSPIREADAMLIFYKLWRDGVIDLA